MVLVGPQDLTEPERQVWDAFATGEWVDLRTGDRYRDDPVRQDYWGPGRIVRANVIRALLLGASEREPGEAPGIRLRGARISGRLDLMGTTIDWPLVCEYCQFDNEVRLVESETKTIRITHSRLPGLNATRIRLDGILNLWCSVVPGLVRLDQAKINGKVCLASADVGARHPFNQAVSAAGLDVDGSLDFSGLIAHGEVSIQTARITGSADLSRARISNPREQALGADTVQIGGWLDCHSMVADGEVTLYNARVGGGVTFDAASLSNARGQALSAEGLSVGGGLLLSSGFTSVGEVRLVGAQLEAQLTLSGAKLSNPDGIAINFDRASVGVCQGTSLTCTGLFSFAGAQFASTVDLSGALIDSGGGDLALAGDGAVIGGQLVLRKLRSYGELNLRSVRIGRGVLMMSTELSNPGSIACRLSGADISGDLYCQHLSAAGAIRMTGARVGGRIHLEQVRLANEGGPALSARGLQAGQFLLEPAEPILGVVDLSHARIDVFRDDPACWPAQLNVDGLTYQALEPRLPARDRLRWLRASLGGPRSQPYEYLADHYVRIGQPEEATTVWYAREREQRKEVGLLLRLWGLVQDVTLGYGYRPWRALAWLGIMLTAGSIIYGISPPPAFQSPHPNFNPVIYTLDLLLPLVDLGMKHAFNPKGFDQYLSYVLIASGWVFVTTIAAAAARVLQRG